MPNTPNITTGIKAIKVAKTDALGNNQTLQLQKADVLRINFDDLGTLNFTITSITEYSDCYLYYVVPTSIGNDLSYFSNPILPKNVSGSNTDSIFISGSNPVGVFRSYQSKTGVSGSLSESSGLFFVPSSQIDPYTIQVTCSFNIKFSVDPISTGNPIIVMMSGSYTDPDVPRTYNNILGAAYVPLNTRTTSSFYPVTCSFTVNPGYVWNNDSLQGLNNYFNGNASTKISPVYESTFGLYFQNPYSGTEYQFIIQTGSINVTLNQLHTSSNDINGNLTVIEPYYTTNYQTSEYNAIINNAVVSREDGLYMDVDFTSNAIIAVNEQSILNGSATRAAVQPSNYTTTRVINPRYNGCKTESSTGSIFESFVNQPMTNGSTIGAVANVENYCNWFAYFDNITSGSVYYKINDFTSIAGLGYIVHITSLIDINGNIIDLSPNNNILITGNKLATTASVTATSASLANFITPTGSFSINGINIAITGSTKPANNATTIFIASGSSPANTVAAIANTFNFSSSVAPYNSYLQYISASVSASTSLVFNTTSSQIGTVFPASILNAYTYISGSRTTKFSGSTNTSAPNPLISNIPIINTIFPYSFNGNSFNEGIGNGISVEIRQFVTSGSQSPGSGSFGSYDVLFTGIQSTYNGSYINGVFGKYNETIVTLNPFQIINSTSSLISSPETSIPGLLIPQNFNPNYKNNLLKIAQSAGFFKNI